MTKVKITITGNRKELNEGRTYGLGFAVARKTGENSFETVTAPSTCKDYLNDVVFVEKFTAPEAKISIFGLDYQFRGDVLEKDGTGYLYIRPLADSSSNNGLAYSVDREAANLEQSLNTITSGLHDIEERLDFKTRTEILQTEPPGGYIVVGPAEWFSSPYMISLYSFLIRHLQHVKTDSLASILMGGSGLEASMLSSIKYRLDVILKTKKLPNYPAKNYYTPGVTTVSSAVHGYGIMSWMPQNDHPGIKMDATSYLAILK